MQPTVCALFHGMATYTKHAVERRAEREIKQAYIELCLSHGTRRNIEHTPSPLHSGLFINKHHYKGLVVLSVPNTHPPTVITAYWTVEVKEDINRCIQRFDQRLCSDKRLRDKHATRAKESTKYKNLKKSGSKSTRAYTMSMNVDAEDLDDLDY